VTISTDNLLKTNEFRDGEGAQWPFLSDPERVVQRDLDIQEYTDPTNNPMIPHTLVLEPALKIHKITAATNSGHVVNPAQIERQVAGSFAYGLSAALYGEITVKDGAVEQTNFDSYNVMRMDEMPKVETVHVPSGGFWGGVGEPTIAVAAPAVLNGIYKATGKRVRDLPLMHQELKKGA